MAGISAACGSTFRDRGGLRVLRLYGLAIGRFVVQYPCRPDANSGRFGKFGVLRESWGPGFLGQDCGSVVRDLRAQDVPNSLVFGSIELSLPDMLKAIKVY